MTTTVTLYKLFLGDQDATIGHYRQGYTIHSITAAIFPNGGTFNFGNLGYHTTYSATGFTQYNVMEGDLIYDSFGRYYRIKGKHAWTSGDVFQFYSLDLESDKPLEYEFPDGLIGSDFFGFEDVDHGTIGYEFEEGFERGYWFI